MRKIFQWELLAWRGKTRFNSLSMHNSLNNSWRRRHLLATLAMPLAPLALVACTGPVPTLRIGTVVYPGYEFIYLARAIGLLDETRVRMIELQTNADTLRALAAGQLEGAALTLDELLRVRADGVDLRAVLIFDLSAGANAVMVHAPVTLRTLAGARIGFEDSETGNVMLAALLLAAGLRADQIQKVPVRLDRTEEVFRLGAVDAVVTAEPWASRLERSGARRLFDSAAIPGRIVDVLAVRARVLQTHGAALKYLIAGHFAAQQFFRSSPQRAAQWMAPRLQTPEAEVAGMFRGLQLPDARQNQDMMRSPRSLAPQLLPRLVDWNQLVDARFLSP